MEATIDFLGTVTLYLISWFVVFAITLVTKERYFKRVDDWFTGPTIAFVVATVIVTGVFIYNHIRFVPQSTDHQRRSFLILKSLYYATHERRNR